MKKLIFKVSIMVFIMSSISFAKTITIRGIIKIKGSAPHTYIVIEDIKTHKDYKVINTDDFNIQNMQNNVVVLKANIIKKAIGAGFPAVIEIIKIYKNSI